MVDTVLVGTIIGGAVSIVVAVVGHLGKKADNSSSQLSTLMGGMEKRIINLEERLEKNERELERTKNQLFRFQSHADALRRALGRAVAWIGAAVEWMNSDRSAQPPTPPDSEAWQELLASVAVED